MNEHHVGQRNRDVLVFMSLKINTKHFRMNKKESKIKFQT